MPPNIFNIRYMKSQMIHSLTWNKMSIFKEISKTFCFLSLQHFLFIPYFPAYSSSFSLILFFFKSMISLQGFPRWLSGKESAWQCRRCRRRGFNPWIRKIPWSKKWQPAPVFLPGKFHGQRSLVGYSLWGCKESDMTEQLSMHAHVHDFSKYFSIICISDNCIELPTRISLWKSHNYSIFSNPQTELSITQTSFCYVF